MLQRHLQHQRLLQTAGDFMSRSKERLDRAERSHQEAAAMIAQERAERERKTAKLRELRLAQEKNGPNETKPVKAGTNTKVTVAMMKAARTSRLKAKLP